VLKKLRELLSDAGAYGAAGVMSQVIGFLLLPLYTRQLTRADYGSLALLAVFPTLFATLAAAGVKMAVFKQMFQSDDPRRRGVVLSTAALSVLVSSLLLLGVTLPAAPWIAEALLGDAGLGELVTVALISAAAATVAEVPSIALQAARRARTVAAINVCSLLLTIAATVYLVVVQQAGAKGVLLGGLVGTCGSGLIGFAVAAKQFVWGFDVAIWRQMARFALPFLPHRLQSVVMVFYGEYLIRTYVGLGELGLYSVAARFALPITFFGSAILTAWNPYKFKVRAEDANPAEFFRSALTFFIGTLTYLWVGISLWGPEVCRLMTAPEFHGAAMLIGVIAFSRMIQSTYPMLGTGIELGNSMRAVPLISFGALVTLVVVGTWLVPQYGAYGAALATASAWSAMGLGSYLLAQRQYRVDYDWPLIAALVGSAAVLVLIARWLQAYPIGVRLTAAVGLSLIYPAIGGALLLRSRSERARTRRVLAALQNRFTTKSEPQSRS